MKVLIITDIHANLRALSAVLNRFDDVDAVWCLGDIVEIGPKPGSCIDLVRSVCRHVVKGNHDESFTEFVPNEAPVGWNGWERPGVTEEQLDYLRALPQSCTASCDGRIYLLVHGSPENPLTGRLDPDTDEEVLTEALEQHVDGILCGHTHIAMIRPVGSKVVVNAGTVGQPRDGDYRAQCMILEDGEFTYHLVPYDLDELEQDYRQSELPRAVQDEWIQNTRSGIVSRHRLRKGPLSRT